MDVDLPRWQGPHRQAAFAPVALSFVLMVMTVWSGNESGIIPTIAAVSLPPSVAAYYAIPLGRALAKLERGREERAKLRFSAEGGESIEEKWDLSRREQDLG